MDLSQHHASNKNNRVLSYYFCGFGPIEHCCTFFANAPKIYVSDTTVAGNVREHLVCLPRYCSYAAEDVDSRSFHWACFQNFLNGDMKLHAARGRIRNKD